MEHSEQISGGSFNFLVLLFDNPRVACFLFNVDVSVDVIDVVVVVMTAMFCVDCSKGASLLVS